MYDNFYRVWVRYGTRLKDGMVFNLSVGLQDVPLSASERKGSGAANMETFSVMIAGGSTGGLVCMPVGGCFG